MSPSFGDAEARETIRSQTFLMGDTNFTYFTISSLSYIPFMYKLLLKAFFTQKKCSIR